MGTTPLGLRYPEVTDRVADGAGAMRRLAEDVEAKLLPRTGLAALNPVTGWFHADGYGAKGDGTTDDTAAVQAAVDAASARGGGVVYLRPGVYLCNVVLKPHVTLRSDAANYGYLPGTPVSTATLKAQSAGWVVSTVAGGATTAGIEGVNIDGASIASGVQIGGGTAWAAIRRVMFNDTAGIALQILTNTVACVVEDILAINPFKTGLPGVLTGVIDIDGTDHFLSRIEASGSRAVGTITSTNLYLAAIVIRGADHFLSTLVGEFADIGIAHRGARCRYVNCRSDTNGAHGITSTGGGTWTNCASRNNGNAVSNTYSGVYVTGGGERWFGLVVEQTGTPHYKYGIEDTCNTSAVQSRNVYIAPLIGGYSTAAVSTVDFLGSTVINAPLAVRPNSGTSLDVTGTSLLSPQHGSPTTVTELTGGVTGQVLKVMGHPNVTLGVSGNIQTNTGVAKQIKNAQIYTFTYYQGKWRENVDAVTGSAPQTVAAAATDAATTTTLANSLRTALINLGLAV